MSNPQVSEPSPVGDEHAELMSALFAQMVMQQSNLTMMLLGKTPHPESGETMRDIEGARLFIDQLEMLELKTKGNLSKEETMLLKQSLMALRLAFVECVNTTPHASEPPAEGRARPEASAPAAEPARPVEPTGAPGDGEESRKKFTKKY
jgi:hypothetical protein